MAVKKKAKKSKKTKSKKVKKSPVKKAKKVKKKPVVKKKAAKKKSASKPKAKKAAVRKPAAAKPMPVTIPGEERVGIVTHYYNHLSVAIIQLETGTLRAGDTIHIKGHTSDFRQPVGSIEVNHVHVEQVQAGESFGVKVNDHAREHDVRSEERRVGQEGH